MSSNFNFYVNRQGVQGKRGAKGEQGFSPVISVESQTANEYILKVENEDGSFFSPNLRGNAIENNGGTYIRFNPETEQMYTGFADEATTEQAGVVRMGTYEDLVAGESEELIPNVADVHDYVLNNIGASGFVTTEQFNTYTTTTDAALLSLSTNKLNKSTYDAYVLETASTLNGLSTNKLDASTFNSYTTATDAAIGALYTNKLDFTDLTNTLVQGSNITLTTDTVNKKITISSSGGGGGTQVQSNWAETDNTDPSFIQNKPTLFSGDYDDLTNKPVLGTMASESASDYTPTANLANVATTGDYDDLLNKPTIPAAQVQSDWNQSDSNSVDFIKNKPTLTVDSAIDSTSENPVQNKVIASALDNKQDVFNANIPLSMSQEIISPATNGSGTGYYFYWNDTNGYNESAYIRYIGSSGSSSDYRHTSTIPFEFDKIYKLTGTTGELVLSNGRPLSTFYAFGKYVPDLNKVVPYMMLPKVGVNGVVSSQTFNLITHDTTGEAVVNSYASESCSISQVAGSDLGTGMFCQKKLISGKIVLYIGARFSNSFYLYTIQDASGSTAFTDIMNDCNNIILMTDSMRSVIGSRYSDAEDDLINITSATQLGAADSSLFTTEAIYGESNLNLKYDNSTIKVNSNNQIYVDQSALTSKQDALVSGTNIKTINGTSVLGSGDITIGGGSSLSSGNGININQSNEIDIVQEDSVYNWNDITIVGTPTLVYGVYSGFSNNDYIYMNDYPSSVSSFEMQFDFITGTLDNTNQLLTYPKTEVSWKDAPYIFVNSENKAVCRFFDNGSDVMFYSTSALSSNTEYVLKLVFNGLTASCTIETGETEANMENRNGNTTVSVSTVDFNDAIKIGCQSWTGGVRLDNSYIKVNNSYYGVTTSNPPAKATSSLYGLVKPDGSTTQVTNGIISTINTVQSSTVNTIVQITQADYDLLATKDANTLYVIIPASS